MIDQYDTDDLDDGVTGNTITIINYNNNTNNYAYGMESMSYDDPAVNQSRPPSAPETAGRRRNFLTGVLRMSASLVTPIIQVRPR